ncbi:tyrosine-type recombinase/integrase [Streptomyces sp. NPDC088551]|uniref:tyrosine-type recombinase/integrase n=1 Tax=Streptomyces sp. NPDC088551 TaxID=3365863 RepID=UPI00380CDAC2
MDQCRAWSTGARWAGPVVFLVAGEGHDIARLGGSGPGHRGGDGVEDSGYVFTNPDGAPIEGATLTRRFNTLPRRAGLRRIRFHDLRHSAATSSWSKEWNSS